MERASQESKANRKDTLEPVESMRCVVDSRLATVTLQLMARFLREHDMLTPIHRVVADEEELGRCDNLDLTTLE